MLAFRSLIPILPEDEDPASSSAAGQGSDGALAIAIRPRARLILAALSQHAVASRWLGVALFAAGRLAAGAREWRWESER